MTGGPGLVVMDLDGTLVRLAVDWDALRARLRPLAHAAGIEAGGVGTMSAAARRRAGDPAVAALLAALGEAEERGARAAEVDAAVTRAVAALPAGLPVAVCSANGRAAVLAALRRAGLERRVTAVAAREDVRRPKPDPEGIVALAARAAVEPSSVLMVGDTDADRGAARAAGARFLDVAALRELAGRGEAGPARIWQEAERW